MVDVDERWETGDSPFQTQLVSNQYYGSRVVIWDYMMCPKTKFSSPPSSREFLFVWPLLVNDKAQVSLSGIKGVALIEDVDYPVVVLRLESNRIQVESIQSNQIKSRVIMSRFGEVYLDHHNAGDLFRARIKNAGLLPAIGILSLETPISHQAANHFKHRCLRRLLSGARSQKIRNHLPQWLRFDLSSSRSFYLYLSSSDLWVSTKPGFCASTYALPDEGFIAWPDMVAYCERVRAVIPGHHIIVDIDDGYGDPLIAANVS